MDSSPRPATFPPPCPVRAAVAAVLASADAHGLLVVPSLTTTVTAIPAWQRAAPHVAVVAPSIAGTLAPTELLAQLKPASVTRPRLALVFSDQLVSPLHAPLLVTHGGHAQYLSGLEAVAHVGYGFGVSAWVDGGFERAPAGCSTADVLRLLLRHHAACDALGEAWLMRGAQAARSPAVRAGQARRQLRLFHSALMHASRGGPLPAGHRPIVKRLDDLHRRLAAATGT